LTGLPPPPPWSSTTSGGSSETVRYNAPETIGGSHRDDSLFRTQRPGACQGDCSICLEDMKRPGEAVVGLKVCGHAFHRSCIKEYFEHAKTCPICRKVAGEPQGKSPSGTMSVSTSSSMRCSGNFDCGSIVINYMINGGVQKPYHDQPGVRHGSDSRTAYIPDNAEGQKLLKRLKYAFQHGLTFTVGTSMTTGMPNRVTWASIHHKTSPTGGPHGFPDPNFFANCNAELDNAGVP
jgi:deltex-like protein